MKVVIDSYGREITTHLYAFVFTADSIPQALLLGSCLRHAEDEGTEVHRYQVAPLVRFLREYFPAEVEAGMKEVTGG